MDRAFVQMQVCAYMESVLIKAFKSLLYPDSFFQQRNAGMFNHLLSLQSLSAPSEPELLSQRFRKCFLQKTEHSPAPLQLCTCNSAQLLN